MPSPRKPPPSVISLLRACSATGQVFPRGVAADALLAANKTFSHLGPLGFQQVVIGTRWEGATESTPKRSWERSRKTVQDLSPHIAILFSRYCRKALLQHSSQGLDRKALRSFGAPHPVKIQIPTSSRKTFSNLFLMILSPPRKIFCHTSIYFQVKEHERERERERGGGGGETSHLIFSGVLAFLFFLEMSLLAWQALSLMASVIITE